MKKLIGLMIVLMATAAFALTPPNAVGSLYVMDASGSFNFICTASVVDGTALGLKQPEAVLTAEHCVDDKLARVVTAQGKFIWTTTGQYFIAFNNGQSLYPLTLIRAGYQQHGYDLSLFLFSDRTPTNITPLEFGDWSKVQLGTPLRVFSNPLGVGLEAFTGYVSMLTINRPLSNWSLNWRGYFVSMLPAAPGSSGSLILNDKNQVIGVLIGFVQAQDGYPLTVGVPESRFARFLADDVWAGRPIVTQ